jgi:hypothetical protein
MHAHATAHPLIALTGYSRCGKDVAADALVSIGYERRCFGDIIKHLVQIAGPSEWEGFAEWLQETNRNSQRISQIATGWSVVKDLGYSPFTQDDDVKPMLRPILEDYGIWKYNEVVEQFFHNLPAKCVNSRLCRVDEGKMWRDRGGIIVKIIRPGNDSHTEVERIWMEELHEACLIDMVVGNDGDIHHLHEAIKKVAVGS